MPAATAKNKSKRKRRKRVNQQTLMLGAVLLVLVVVVIFSSLSGCSVSHGSAQKVVKSLLRAYGDGKEKLVKDCYGQKKETEEELQTQIDAMFAFMQAHEATDIEVQECDVISSNGNTFYVYAIYGLVVDKDSVYPCLSTYMVRKEGKNYRILAPSEITQEMKTASVTDFEKFTSTDSYKQYMVDYSTFIKKNPGYEERIAIRLGQV